VALRSHPSIGVLSRDGRSRLRRTRRVALFFVIAACLLPGCNRSSSGPALQTVRLALSRDAITWLPVLLAQKLGYYPQEGLSLALSDVGGLSKSMEALLGGSVDVAGASPILVLQLALEGRPVQSFLTLYTGPYAALVVAPAATGSIHTIADLKGRRVGVSSPGSPSHLFLNFSLVSHGLSPDDVSTVSIGTAAQSVAAVEHGQVDAAELVGNAITMLHRRHPDMRFLADTRTPEGTQAVFGSPAFPSTSLVATQSWLKANADTARRLVRATQKAMQWMREHSAEEVRAEMTDTQRMPDADADLEAIRGVQHTLSRDGAMPAEGPELVRKVLAASNAKARTALLDLSPTYTNEFVIKP
jgi:NitT/TauT family transport system substrate-binding protein